MNIKTKMIVVGALLTTGILGTSPVFAATSSSTANATATSSNTTIAQSTPHQSAERHGGFGHGGFHHGGHGGFVSSAATILGMDQQTLQADLKDGQSIAKIAQRKGIDEQTIITDLQNNLKKNLAARVSSGKLSSTQEQQILTHFSNRAKKMVESTSLFSSQHGTHSSQTTNSATDSTTESNGN